MDATAAIGRVLEPDRADIVRRERLLALEEAHEIRSQALAEAEQIRADTRVLVEQLRRDAERTGYEAGLAQAVVDRSRIALREEQLDQRALARSIEIARLLAERLVGRSIEVDDSTVLDMAHAVLTEVRGAREICFVAHPEDAKLLSQALQKDTVSPIPISVQASDELARGDFHLRTDGGVLKASLGERLDVLARALSESME